MPPLLLTIETWSAKGAQTRKDHSRLLVSQGPRFLIGLGMDATIRVEAAAIVVMILPHEKNEKFTGVQCSVALIKG